MGTMRKRPPLAEEKPKCIEISAGSSVGGSVQIVKYEYTAKFDYWLNAKYEIPEGWSEQDAKDFRQDKIIELRTQLEGIAQAEMDELMEQKKELN